MTASSHEKWDRLFDSCISIQNEKVGNLEEPAFSIFGLAGQGAISLMDMSIGPERSHSPFSIDLARLTEDQYLKSFNCLLEAFAGLLVRDQPTANSSVINGFEVLGLVHLNLYRNIVFTDSAPLNEVAAWVYGDIRDAFELPICDLKSTNSAGGLELFPSLEFIWNILKQRRDDGGFYETPTLNVPPKAKPPADSPLLRQTEEKAVAENSSEARSGEHRGKTTRILQKNVVRRAPVEKSVAEKRIYLFQYEILQGPFTPDDVRLSVERDAVDADCLACLEGTEEWLPLSQLVNLKRRLDINAASAWIDKFTYLISYREHYGPLIGEELTPPILSELFLFRGWATQFGYRIFSTNPDASEKLIGETVNSTKYIGLGLIRATQGFSVEEVLGHDYLDLIESRWGAYDLRVSTSNGAGIPTREIIDALMQYLGLNGGSISFALSTDFLALLDGVKRRAIEIGVLRLEEG